MHRSGWGYENFDENAKRAARTSESTCEWYRVTSLACLKNIYIERKKHKRIKSSEDWTLLKMIGESRGGAELTWYIISNGCTLWLVCGVRWGTRSDRQKSRGKLYCRCIFFFYNFVSFFNSLNAIRSFDIHIIKMMMIMIITIDRIKICKCIIIDGYKPTQDVDDELMFYRIAVNFNVYLNIMTQYRI